MSETNVLYRFYDFEDRLLYIGITADPGSRWKHHSKRKPWWHDVTRVDVQHYPTRAAVLEAERVAIIAEHPRHNIAHNRLTQQSRLASAEPELMPDDCHDVCANAGVFSIYYPYRWADGIGRYRCNRGHSWVCHWGLQGSGQAMEWFGNPVWQTTRDQLAAAQNRRSEGASK